MKKTFAILMALTLVLSSFGFMSVSAATTPWDGVTADIKWYLDNIDADTFTISNANEWAGLVEIVATYNADEGEVKKDPNFGISTKLYYDENGLVVTDASKQSETRVLTKTDENFPVTNFKGKTVKLAADIDLAGKSIKPLGYPKNFEGTLDGQNHTVKNLNTSAFCAKAMFNGDRYVYGALIYVAVSSTVVKNIKVENAVLDLTVNQTVATPASQKRLFCGGLAGYTNGRCTFENVTVNGLTVTINATDLATQRVLWGVMTSVLFSAQEEDMYIFKNITVTGYTLNNPNNYPVASVVSIDEEKTAITDLTSTDRLFGMNAGALPSQVTFENVNVTYGAYVPTTPETQAPTTQAPAASDSTVVPPEGDSVVAIVALAAVAATGILFVSRKRKED